MPKLPRYVKATAPVAFRVTEDTRRILDYVVLTTGAPSVSDYVRAVLDAHLIGLGFRLSPGIHSTLPQPPDPDEVRAWQATEVADPWPRA